VYRSESRYSLWSPYRWNATLPYVARWRLCAGRPDGTPVAQSVSRGSSLSLQWLPRPSIRDYSACRLADTNASKSGTTCIWKRYSESSNVEMQYAHTQSNRLGPWSSRHLSLGFAMSRGTIFKAMVLVLILKAQTLGLVFESFSFHCPTRLWIN